jgi:ATPase family AAA domain-containing protein 3A/B
MYEFKFDSVKGRHQMGVLGIDAEQYFPDSVEVIPSYTVPNKEFGKPSLQIKNFPMVDKNVLFVHCLAAVRELIGIVDSFQKSIEELHHSGSDQKYVFEELERRLSKEADAQLVEEQKYAIQQKLLAEKELELSKLALEEERKRIVKELADEKENFEYQEKLYNERILREEAILVNRMNEALKFERELTERRELLRRETDVRLQTQKLEYERQMESEKAKYQENYIRAEIQAKADQERANEDVTIRKIKLQANLDSKRMVEGLAMASAQLAKFTRSIVSHPKQCAVVVVSMFIALFVYYSIKEFSLAFRQYVQSKLGRPSLVRETSYARWSSLLPLGLYRLLHGRESLQIGMEHINKCFKDVVLCDSDKEHVIQLALSTRNTKQSNAPFRHVLLHGPPGTGKTLIARKLAECSGMDYAIMSGGDIGPLGDDAVNQLHALFRWASTSKRGLLVFIDESESFMGSREKNMMQSPHVRHALNALLYQTGTQSKSFMLVLATNRPEELDSAVLDRIDVSLFIGLPAYEQRVDLVKLYFKMSVLDVADASNKSKIFPVGSSQQNVLVVEEDCQKDSTITKIAKQIEGFSGREISKLMIAMQYRMILSENKTLTLAGMEDEVSIKIEEHSDKKLFVGNNSSSNSKTK